VSGASLRLPCASEDLPPIDFVLISHDHYDHLDEPTVRRLSELFNPTFVVPWGIKAWLADRGITNAVELGWGQSVSLKGLTIVCTPAQHGSGRTMVDQGRRLWASWAVLGSQRFYFAGDTGYYSHFKDIGDALGPFDLAALPIGSYTPVRSPAPSTSRPRKRSRPGPTSGPSASSASTGALSCSPGNLMTSHPGASPRRSRGGSSIPTSYGSPGPGRLLPGNEDD
jgi:Predicted Zn-dependent hydrolases of the beta-lactamase fold